MSNNVIDVASHTVGTNSGDALRQLVRSVARRGNVVREFKEFNGLNLNIKRLTALEVDQYQMGMVGKDGKVDMTKAEGMRCRLLNMCIVDDDGNRAFAPDEIATWDNDFVQAIFKACQEVNHLEPEKKEEAGKD